MSKTQRFITGIGFAVVLAACGSGGSNNPPAAGGTTDSSGGSSVNPNGGSAGETGGTVSNPSGGTVSNPSGGTVSNPSGGTVSNPSGGTVSSGGTTVKPSGGGAGGSGGNGGTTTVNPNGGSGGQASGGTTVKPSGTGGAQNGGVQGTGGSAAPGTGGATPVANTLVTSAAGAFWKSGTLTESTSNANVTVDDTKTVQTWDGFGGAFNEMGWSYLTTDAMKTQAIAALFGKDGCNFAWGRIPIGASDYAMDRYTDDEVASGSTDLNMEKFSITRDKEKLIPFIKAAQAVKPELRFWASPWTPPTWMKATPYLSGNPTNAFDGGTMKSDEATLKAFAQYLIKWVQAFQVEGIKVEIVAPQNEPNYQQNYPSCHWETANFVNFVGKHFGPAITSAGISLKIMDGTLSNTSGDSDIGQQILKDTTAKGYIGAIGVQWGMAASNQVTALRNLAGGIPIWVSEHQCGGTMGSTAPAPNDQAYGQTSWNQIRDAIKNQINGYNSWNMVLNKGGMGIDNTRKWPQNALIVADSGALTMTPAYYAFRHYAQFVAPGAKVVSTSGGDAVAFKNPDGSIVAVMNSTSANNNYVVAFGSKKFQFAMPNGWATIRYKP